MWAFSGETLDAPIAPVTIWEMINQMFVELRGRGHVWGRYWNSCLYFFGLFFLGLNSLNVSTLMRLVLTRNRFFNN